MPFLTRRQALLALGAAPRAWAAKREVRAGWITVRLSGSPRELGFQHGQLLAREIEDAHRVVKHVLTHDTKKEYSFFRDAAENVLWPKITGEYREEIEGIVEGLKSRGGSLDATDVVFLNAWNELVPYYVTWYDRKHKVSGTPRLTAPEHCSAFVATGSYTKNGRPVMGHNAWTGYAEGQRWNIIFDIQPASGHKILMDGYPGMIHSGDDFGINSTGIMITETTISGFVGFDPGGVPEFVRARQAMQYASSIDDFARIMKEGNNGGYANNWLLADCKTNEAASLELGLKHVTLNRTTDGWFSGSNYPVSPKLLAEETENFDANDLGLSANARRLRWQQLLEQHKGRIDVRAGQRFLADHHDSFEKTESPNERTLCGHIDRSPRGVKNWQAPWAPAGAVQNKVADAAMAERMALTASMGHACGIHFRAEAHLKERPEFAHLRGLLHDLPSQPWTEFRARR
jgi:hypothetical protein